MNLCIVVTIGDGLTARQGEGGIELDDANVSGRAAYVVVVYGNEKLRVSQWKEMRDEVNIQF